MKSKTSVPRYLETRLGIWEHEMLHGILNKALFVRLHAGLLVLSLLFNKKLGFYILSKAADSILSG